MNENTRKLCEKWIKDPLINPETGKSIEKDGPTYTRWKQRALKYKLKPITGHMTWKKCQEWRKNPTVNPETGRIIQMNGVIYKRIEKQCRCMTNEKVLDGEYVIPSSDGYVDCVKENGRYYVIRRILESSASRIDSRDRCPQGKILDSKSKVYGPLNKTVGGTTQKAFYTDTWDWKTGKYKPFFTSISPPQKKSSSVSIPSKSLDIVASQLLSPKPKKQDAGTKFINLFLK